ncbi:MAG: UDP-N-acetylmuramate dehydrogenase [Deltaproteobacteria bacterium]|nr:UDP-N-acetylmuramate dehydrogenase [Deltaproteobacteria bacterium]
MAIPGDFRDWLSERFGPCARFGEPMSRHTSLGVGGPAEAWISVPDLPGLIELVSKMRQAGLSWRITGRGTNLWVRDEGLSGVVMTLGKGFTGIGLIGEDSGLILVRAGAGASLSALCRFAIKHGFSGMNFAVGIPGSVGGAVSGNAGTAAGCVADRITGLEIITPDAAPRRIDRNDLDFSYRSLARAAEFFGSPERPSIITGAIFALKPGNGDEIAAEAEALAARRKASQPWGVKSAGCFFKNPKGASAGQLIDKAGLKGLRVNDALVSPVHANFLVNAGHASSSDFLALVEMVKGEVKKTFGVELELEVITPGD